MPADPRRALRRPDGQACTRRSPRRWPPPAAALARPAMRWRRRRRPASPRRRGLGSLHPCRGDGLHAGGLRDARRSRARAIFARDGGDAGARPCPTGCGAGGEATAPARLGGFLDADPPLLLIPVSAEPPFPQGLDETGLPPRVPGAGADVPDGAARAAERRRCRRGWSDGLPMGVQVVAPRWREDLALDAAEAIEAAFPMPTPIDPRQGGDRTDRRTADALRRHAFGGERGAAVACCFQGGFTRPGARALPRSP